MEKEPEPKPRPTPEPAREVEADPRVVANRCPLCRESVRPDVERWVVCAQCLARQHTECWDEVRRCASCNHTERMLAPSAAQGPRSTARPPKNPLRALLRRHLFPLIFGSIFGGIGAVLFIVFTALWIAGARTDTGHVWPWWPSLVPLVCVAIGGVSLGFFARGLRRDSRILREGAQVDGEVVEVREDHSVRVNGRPLLRVHYEFEDEARTMHDGRDGTFDRAWAQAAGRKVRVAYLPGSPRESLVIDLLQ